MTVDQVKMGMKTRMMMMVVVRMMLRRRRRMSGSEALRVDDLIINVW